MSFLSTFYYRTYYDSNVGRTYQVTVLYRTYSTVRKVRPLTVTIDNVLESLSLPVVRVESTVPVDYYVHTVPYFLCTEGVKSPKLPPTMSTKTLCWQHQENWKNKVRKRNHIAKLGAIGTTDLRWKSGEKMALNTG